MNKHLSELLKKYPNAKIYTFTHYEVIGEDYGYWLGKIKTIYYGSWWEYDEKMYLDKNGLLEEIEDFNENYDDVVKEHKGIIITIGV